MENKRRNGQIHSDQWRINVERNGQIHSDQLRINVEMDKYTVLNGE